jgi:hypothetical protein
MALSGGYAVTEGEQGSCAAFRIENDKPVKVVGEAPAGKYHMYQPNCAEGRFLYGTYMAKADPKDFRKLSKSDWKTFDIAGDTSSAYACGWVFRRGKEGILCYDLRKSP